jgi:hypothetical protein
MTDRDKDKKEDGGLMTDRDKDKKEDGGLAQLAQLQPPDWIQEMQRYYRQHGAYRAEDVARLLGHAGRAGGTQATIELLQQVASNGRSWAGR